jgi:type II secretory pathway pseudopilin PulG
MRVSRASAGYSAIELLVVLTLAGTVAAMATPMSMSMVASYRLSGDAHSLSNSAATAKMTAAAQFTRARLFIDLAAGTYRVETWRRTGAPGWVTEGAAAWIDNRHRFTAGAIAAPPPNTQAAVAQPAACLDNAGAAIANTACILYNSRGIAIDAAGAPTAPQVLYLSGSTDVYAIAVFGTSQLQMWRIPPGGGTWRQQ